MQLSSFNATAPRFGNQYALPPGPSKPEQSDTGSAPIGRMEDGFLTFDVSQLKGIRFKDGDKTLAELGADSETGGFLETRHPTQKGGTRILQTPEGNALMGMYNQTGKAVAVIGTTSGGSLDLANPDGKMAVTQGYSPAHQGGTITYYNNYGNAAAMMGAINVGAGELQLYPANGQGGSGLNAQGQTLRIRG